MLRLPINGSQLTNRSKYLFSQIDEGTDVNLPENTDDNARLEVQSVIKSPGPSPKKQKGKVLMTSHLHSNLYTDRKIIPFSVLLVIL